MANLSEWLGAPAAPQPLPPLWLAQLGEGTGFREALPFAALAPAPEPAPEPEPEPQVPEPGLDPAPDPLALAYAEGEAAGRAAAEGEAAVRAAQQRALRLTFRALDETALAMLADDLAATVQTLCEQALEGCAIDRAALLARCHAAAARIGGAAEALVLRLHPADIAVLGDESAIAVWRIAPDPALARGSVVIEGPEGAVSDGPAEWCRAIAAALRP